MISMTSTPGAIFKGPATGLTYRADAQGLIHFVRTGDVDALRAAGAEPIILPATKNLKFKPGQSVHFAGKIHQADERGLLLSIPHDQAVTLIRSGAATEASEADIAAHQPVEPEPTAEPVEPEPDEDDELQT